MDLIVFSYVAFGAFVTSIISSIAGFGGGILVIVMFSFFFDIKTAIAMSSVLFFFNSLNKIFLFRETIDWKFARNIIIGAVPATAVGLMFFNVIDPIFINYLLAGVASLMILKKLSIFRWGKPLKMTTRNTILGGGVWGIFGGIAPAPIIKVYLLQARGLSKEWFIGTGAAMTLAIDCLKLPVFLSTNWLSFDTFLFLTPLFVVMFVGTCLGKKILKKISPELFEKIVLIMVGVSVIKFLFFS